jgi:hypothetical protein
VLELAIENRDVGRSSAQATERIDEAGEMDHDFDLGMRGREPSEGGCHQPPGERRDIAHGQPRRLRTGGACRDDGVLGAGKKRPSMLARGSARLRQLDTPGIPVHQTRAYALFKLTDLGAQRLLRQVQSLRRTREVELLGERQQCPEMAHLDLDSRQVCLRDSAAFSLPQLICVSPLGASSARSAPPRR